MIFVSATYFSTTSAIWPFCEAPGLLAAAEPDFCPGDLFYYYELNKCSLKKSKLSLISSSHLGLTVMSLAFHPDDPGSNLGWANFFYKSKEN